MTEKEQEKMISFHTDRINEIKKGNMPAEIHGNAKIIVHLIPADAFSFVNTTNLVSTAKKTMASHILLPMNASAGNSRFNFDGVITIPPVRGDNNSYLQVFRSGIMESVSADFFFPGEDQEDEEDEKIISSLYEKEVLKDVKRNLNFLKDSGITTPIIFFLTMVNVNGYGMEVRHGRLRGQRDNRIEQDILDLPPRLIEDFGDAEKVVKDMFNIFWNACGLEKSENFEGNGAWMP